MITEGNFDKIGFNSRHLHQMLKLYENLRKHTNLKALNFNSLGLFCALL